MDIVEEMRGFAEDHEPDGWPAVRMRQISALCDEIDRLRAVALRRNAELSSALGLAAYRLEALTVIGMVSGLGAAIHEPHEVVAAVKRLAELATPNAIGQGSAACGASPAPTGCAAG